MKTRAQYIEQAESCLTMAEAMVEDTAEVAERGTWRIDLLMKRASLYVELARFAPSERTQP